MRIIFNSPSNPKNLCVAKIDSVEADNATNQLMLYGSFKGRPALFRITTPARMMEVLYHIGKLTLCNEYTAKITTDTATQLVIDFYKE